MQNTDSQLARLARGFFEGALSNDEGQALFGLLQEDEEQRTCFSMMEQTWNTAHVPSAVVEEEWRRIWYRVQGSSPIRTRSRKIYLRCKPAAVAVTLVLVSSLVAYLFSSHHSGPEAYCICIAPLDDKAEVVLPDGSRVWLNAGSDLRYPAPFGDDSRMVELSGEVYLEMAKHAGSKSTINTEGYDVIVHRTKFNVSACDGDVIVITTLLEGSVQMSFGNERVMAAPGEKAIPSQVSGELIKARVSTKANTRAHGNIGYKNITLANLVKVLPRRFNMNITAQSPPLRDERLTILLNNSEDLDSTVRELQGVIPIRVVRQGRNMQILER